MARIIGKLSGFGIELTNLCRQRCLRLLTKQWTNLSSVLRVSAVSWTGSATRGIVQLYQKFNIL